MKKIEKNNSQITKKQKLNYLRNKLKSKKLISTLSAVALVPLPLLAISANIEGKEDINSWGNIKLDTLDNGSHNSTLYSKVAKAKSSGMKSIENVAMHSPLLNDVKFSESKIPNPNDYIHIISMNDYHGKNGKNFTDWYKGYMYHNYIAKNKGFTSSKIIYENITPKSWAQKFKINFKEVNPSSAVYGPHHTTNSIQNILRKNDFSKNDNLVATLDSSTKNNQVIKRYELKDSSYKNYTIELVWVQKDEKWNIQYNYTCVEGDTPGEENDAILVIKINEPSADEHLNAFKTAAIAELEGLEYPNKYDKLHDATLFPRILKIELDAIREINAVTDYKNGDKVKSTQIDLMKKTIDEYNNSTGTDKILANNKAVAIAAINKIDLHIRDDKLHDVKLFHEINQTKTAAINAIQAVIDYKEVNGVKLTQIDLIKKAIDVYNKSTGTDKILTDNKAVAIAAINKIDLPIRDDKLHDATLFPKILEAKTAAINAIQAVTDYKEFDSIKSTQIDLINAAIKAYSNSSGTDQILADNKQAAIAAINAIDLPNKNDESHAAALFPAIDQAKTTAINAIEDVTDYKEVNGVKTTQIDLIKKVIDEYNKSTGTDKILDDNKVVAIAAINAIDLPAPNDKLHDAKLFPAIDQAKKAAINAIQAVTDYKEVDSIKSTQIDLMNTTINFYIKSTGTDKILTDNIAVAIAAINKIDLPIWDDKLHDVTLFLKILETKTAAINAIQAVTDYKEVDGVKLTQIDLINAKINFYIKSTGTDKILTDKILTDKILTDNIAVAIAAINKIDLPNKDDKLHDVTLFPKILEAKTAAINAIQAVIDYKEVNGVKLTQIDLIKKAIDVYNKSTGTDKILTDNKAVAIAAINKIDLPIRDDKLHDATLFPKILEAETAAINAIQAVTDYKEVDSIKSTQIDLMNAKINFYNKSTGTDKILPDNMNQNFFQKFKTSLLIIIGASLVIILGVSSIIIRKKNKNKVKK